MSRDSRAAGDTSAGHPLLEVQELSVAFDLDGGTVRAVHGIDLVLHDGEALGIVGESGSGKSVTALAIMGLLTDPPARIDGGSIRFRGEELVTAAPARRRSFGGVELAMIYQDASAALNPALTIGKQIGHVLRSRLGMSARAARARAAELLDLVGIPDPASRTADHPHEFSGGQRQRLLIALALACDPSVLIADEPTTALDVTVQAQIIELINRLRAELGMAVIWVSHDLDVIAEIADRVAVMYAGNIVEVGAVAEVFARPRHPYTRGLVASTPDAAIGHRLEPIPGTLPPLTATRTSCAFAPRCPLVTDRCRTELPVLEWRDGRATACFRAGDATADRPREVSL